MAMWYPLKVSPEELRLDTTLKCGQSFRWRVSGKDEWTSVLKGRLITLRQTPTSIFYRTHAPEDEPSVIHSLLWDYFQLDLNLSNLYKEWARADPNFAKKAPKLRGIRILRQDPWENLICFICSSNNNISRITQMVEKLCTNYGPQISPPDSSNNPAYYDFPPLSAFIHESLEAELRTLGFGYRAKYIAGTTAFLSSQPASWLESLRTLPYVEARQKLVALPGVGPKVADCVLLMSLDKPEAVPIDTHVWKIAKRDYGFRGGKDGAITGRLYDEVGAALRDVWGKYAGWTHSVLFTAELRDFEKRLLNEDPIKVEAKEIAIDIKLKSKSKVKVETKEEKISSESIDIDKTSHQELPFRRSKRTSITTKEIVIKTEHSAQDGKRARVK